MYLAPQQQEAQQRNLIVLQGAASVSDQGLSMRRQARQGTPEKKGRVDEQHPTSIPHHPPSTSHPTVITHHHCNCHPSSTIHHPSPIITHVLDLAGLLSLALLVLDLAGLLSLALLVLDLCLQDKLPHKRRRASRLGGRGKAALLRAPEHHPQFLPRPPKKNMSNMKIAQDQI